MAQDTPNSRDARSTGSLSPEMASKHDRSANEMVRAGLRHMKDQEPQLEALRAALVAGEASGEAASFDSDAFIADKRA
jgi:antitoxin ParD1/3/4